MKSMIQVISLLHPECTNKTIENDSKLTITETDLSENVTNLNTAIDLADVITGRKLSELIKIILHLLKTINFIKKKQRKKAKRFVLLSNTNGSLTIHGMFIVRSWMVVCAKHAYCLTSLKGIEEYL